MERKLTLDDVNQIRFERGMHVFTCTGCGNRVDMSGSYSCRGRNLICEKCITARMKEKNIDFISDYLKQYIWTD